MLLSCTQRFNVAVQSDLVPTSHSVTETCNQAQDMIHWIYNGPQIVFASWHLVAVGSSISYLSGFRGFRGLRFLDHSFNFFGGVPSQYQESFYCYFWICDYLDNFDRPFGLIWDYKTHTALDPHCLSLRLQFIFKRSPCPPFFLTPALPD